MSLKSISASIRKAADTISGSGTLFNVKVPENTLTSVVGLDGAQITSLGDAVNAVRTAAQNVVQGLRMAGCVVMAFTNASMALNVLNQIGGMAATYALQFAGDIMAAIGQQLMQLLAQILGTVLNVVRAVLSLINAIVSLLAAIKELIDSLLNMGITLKNFWLNQQQCEMMFGMIAACFFNKLLGNKLEKIKQRAIDKITQAGQAANVHLANTLADTNTIANYVEQESFMLNKATAQLRATSNTIDTFSL